MLGTQLSPHNNIFGPSASDPVAPERPHIDQKSPLEDVENDLYEIRSSAVTNWTRCKDGNQNLFLGAQQLLQFFGDIERPVMDEAKLRELGTQHLIPFPGMHPLNIEVLETYHRNGLMRQLKAYMQIVFEIKTTEEVLQRTQARTSTGELKKILIDKHEAAKNLGQEGDFFRSLVDPRADYEAAINALLDYQPLPMDMIQRIDYRLAEHAYDSRTLDQLFGQYESVKNQSAHSVAATEGSDIATRREDFLNLLMDRKKTQCVGNVGGDKIILKPLIEAGKAWLKEKNSPTVVESVTFSDLEEALEQLREQLGQKEAYVHRHSRYTRGDIGDLNQFQIVKHTIEAIKRIRQQASEFITDASLRESLSIRGIQINDRSCLEIMQHLFDSAREDDLIYFSDKVLGFVPHKETLVTLFSEGDPGSFYNMEDTLLSQFQTAREAEQLLGFFRSFESGVPCYEARAKSIIEYTPMNTDTQALLAEEMRPLINGQESMTNELMDYLYTKFKEIKAKAYAAEKYRIPLAEVDESQVTESLQSEVDKRAFKFNNRHDFVYYLQSLCFTEPQPVRFNAAHLDTAVTEWYAAEIMDASELAGNYLRVVAPRRFGEHFDRQGAGLGKDIADLNREDRLPFLPATLIKTGIPISQYSVGAWEHASGALYPKTADSAEPVLYGKRDFGSDVYGHIFGSVAYKEDFADVRTIEDMEALNNRFGIFHNQLRRPDLIRIKQQEYLRRLESPEQDRSTKYRLRTYLDSLNFPLNKSGLNAALVLLKLSKSVRRNPALTRLQHKRTGFNEKTVEAFKSKSGFSEIENALRSLKLEVTAENLNKLIVLLKESKTVYAREFEATIERKLSEKTDEEIERYFSKTNTPPDKGKYELYQKRNEMIMFAHASQICGIYVRCCDAGIEHAIKMQEVYKNKFGINLPYYTYDPLSGQLHRVKNMDTLIESWNGFKRASEEESRKESPENFPDFDDVIPRADAIKHWLVQCLREKRPNPMVSFIEERDKLHAAHFLLATGDNFHYILDNIEKFSASSQNSIIIYIRDQIRLGNYTLNNSGRLTTKAKLFLCNRVLHPMLHTITYGSDLERTKTLDQLIRFPLFRELMFNHCLNIVKTGSAQQKSSIIPVLMRIQIMVKDISQLNKLGALDFLKGKITELFEQLTQSPNIPVLSIGRGLEGVKENILAGQDVLEEQRRLEEEGGPESCVPNFTKEDIDRMRKGINEMRQLICNLSGTKRDPELPLDEAFVDSVIYKVDQMRDLLCRLSKTKKGLDSILDEAFLDAATKLWGVDATLITAIIKTKAGRQLVSTNETVLEGIVTLALDQNVDIFLNLLRNDSLCTSPLQKKTIALLSNGDNLGIKTLVKLNTKTSKQVLDRIWWLAPHLRKVIDRERYHFGKRRVRIVPERSVR